MGWRYLMFTIGGLVLLLSFLRFIFRLHESPRYLIGRGRDTDAVAVVHAIARYNGMETSLSLEELQEAGRSAEGRGERKRWKVLSSSSNMGRTSRTFTICDEEDGMVDIVADFAME